jgi:FkbM family methyltransferase
MFARLAVLKTKGYVPDAILDIGAHHGNWTRAMRNIYPDCTYRLFEAIDYAELAAFSDSVDRTRVSVHNAVLSDEIGETDWFQMRNTGDSMFRELTHHFEKCTVLRRATTTLDTVVHEGDLLAGARNVFLKIDCQGAELPILRGAPAVLAITDFVLLELPVFGQYNAGVPTLLAHLLWMDEAGFIPYDFVENHYAAGFHIQTDVLFIRKTHSLVEIVQSTLLTKY